jgi:hypothetical protein
MKRQPRVQLQKKNHDVARRERRGRERVAEHSKIAHARRSILPRCPSTSQPA